MASTSIYGTRVIKAHNIGDLYIHGSDETRGYWTSWDCSEITGNDSGQDNNEKWVKLANFLERARSEWHCFQRINGLSDLIQGKNDAKYLASLIQRSNDHTQVETPELYLGLDEQFLGSIVKTLLSINIEPDNIITPIINLSNSYTWPKEDIPIFEATSTWMSPIFINKEHKAGYELRNPWLDGGAPGLNTGVIGEITPNLPRAAHDAGNEEIFFEHVEGQIDVAVEGLEAKRAFLEEILKAGHLPATASVVDSFDDFFGAIGVVGVHEALLNLMGKGIDSMKGKAVTYKIIEAMRDRIEAHEKDTGHRFCLEAEPSGDAGYKLAMLDKEKSPEMQASGVEAPFYTRSTCLPVDYSDDLWDALEHQKKLQGMYTGGSIFNVFLERGIADPSDCMMLVKRIFERSQIPCFAISPKLNIQTVTGQEQYNRIGYSYRAVSSLEVGEKEEVGLRKPYDVLSGW